MIFIILFLINTHLKELNNYFKYDISISKTSKDINNYLEQEKIKNTIDKNILENNLIKNKIYTYRVLPLSYVKKENVIDEIKNDINKNKNKYNYFGFDISKNYITLILVNKKLDIKIKGKIKQYNTLNISIKDINYNNNSVKLYIKTPSKVINFLLPKINNEFKIEYKLKEKGEYIFELVDINPKNPQIISKIPIYVSNYKKQKKCTKNINILKEINKIRQKKDLPPLKLYKALSALALNHSKEMANNNFFSHQSKEGKTAYDRAFNKNIKFFKILENISRASSICMAHNEIISSPGHLKNILDEDVDKIGIGIYKKNNVFYLTQNFIESKKNKYEIIYKNIKHKLMKFNIINNLYLNNIAYLNNKNKYNKLFLKQKIKNIKIVNYRKIKAYYSIISQKDDIDSFFEDIQDKIIKYTHFGINFKKFNIDNEKLYFLTLILAK